MSTWTWTTGCKKIISVMINKTLEERTRRREKSSKMDVHKEIKTKESEMEKIQREINELIKNNGDELSINRLKISLSDLKREKEDLQELISDRIKIDWFELKSACADLTRGQFTTFLSGLWQNDFISVYEDTATGKKDKISLSPIWDISLREREKNKKSVELFSIGLGTCLGISLLEKGVKSFKPIAQILEHGSKNNGEISTERVKEIYYEVGLPYSRVAELIETDQYRPLSVKLFVETVENKYIINRDGIRAWEMLRDNTRDRLVGR